MNLSYTSAFNNQKILGLKEIEEIAKNKKEID